MNYNRKNLLEFFKDNKIDFEEFHHKHLFTVDESKQMRGKIKGNHTKNLFLRDKRKNFFLLSCLEDKIVNLKKLKLAFRANNLSFASNDHLNDILELMPGSVSPFGLINDDQKKTKFYLDVDLTKGDSINFHPLVNNYTVNISVESFYDFLKKINVELQLINLEVYRIINNGN